MIVLLSPSKTMNFEDNFQFDKATQPEFLDDALKLVDRMRNYSPEDLGKLLAINDKLAKLNFDRYQSFKTPFKQDNARQAILAYRGDVYDGIAISSYSKADFEFAQEQVRILSGLYGILRPLDLIQPYRLEMSTPLTNERGDNLYQFWGEKLTQNVNEDIQHHETKYVINLASNEYFKALDPEQLKANLITPVFKDNKNGKYKTIAIYAKKARGYMTDYIIRNGIKDPEALKGFDRDGYLYNEHLSTTTEWVFTRD